VSFFFCKQKTAYEVLRRLVGSGMCIRDGQVASARGLGKPELDAIVARLAAAFHTKFDVTQSVDPSLIGGVRITMGDKRADGTIAGRLDDIARLLSTN